MAKGPRYYSPDDPDVGVTRSQLRRLGRAKQLAYMRHWFETYYEDPSQETPRNDGEFLYIWGGPYDAHDQLGDEFGGLVSDERIEEAVEMVQEDGTIEWAPTSLHPSRIGEGDEDLPNVSPIDEADTIEDVLRRLEDGYTVRYGTPQEMAQREVVVRHIEALQAELARIRGIAPGIGHNGAPEDDNGPTVAEAEASAVEIKAELGKQEPDVVKVAAATSRLVRFSRWMRARVDKAIERGVETALTGSVLGAGAYATGMLPAPVVDAIHQIGRSATHWLSMILSAV